MDSFLRDLPYGLLLVFFLFNANLWIDRGSKTPAKALTFGGGSFLFAILMVVLMNTN